MLKIKNDVNLEQLGFKKDFDEFEHISCWLKYISSRCFIAVLSNKEVKKYQVATRNQYFIKFDKEKPIRKRDLILAGLSEKVVEDEW